MFEEYGLPGLTGVNGIVDIADNYPSKGSGERTAWFRDSEGNLPAIGHRQSAIVNRRGSPMDTRRSTIDERKERHAGRR